MTITELYAKEQEYWNMCNIKFFGVSLIDEEKPFSEIQKQLDECCAENWNTENPCTIAQYLNDGTLDKDANKRIPMTYRLALNFYNMCIDIFQTYATSKGNTEFKVACIPTPSIDLCWIVNKAHYCPRITAVRDYFSIVGKTEFDKVSGEGWKYDIVNDKFECTYTKRKFVPTIPNILSAHVSERSRALLEATLGEPLTEDNFVKALKLLPVFDSASIFNYKFMRMEYFQETIVDGYHYAQPTKEIILGINLQIASKAKQYTKTAKMLEGSLVRVESPITALENFRTVVNVYNGDFKPAFCYTDTVGFFDSFKTVTSGSAGRQRLLLDNVTVKDGMLWIRQEDGTEKNMFEMMDDPQDARLSCLSQAPFCNNDKPKRIMMNAKLTSQAVPLAGELDPITHRIYARVGFADIEGYTYADSIAISESFAKRLRTFSKDIIYTNVHTKLFTALYDCHTNHVPIDTDLLSKIYPTKNVAILDSYEDCYVDDFDFVDNKNVRVYISWSIPFRLGDKITNLHGAKGTVGKIIPDDEMPKLVNKVGNMEPGPLEVIVSGFSTMRRGSLGQIFEAWATASGIDFEGEDFAALMIDKYSDEMQKFAEQSVVEFNGERAIVPIGIVKFMRVYHHASTHLSMSDANADYKKLLKLGEMEKFNLMSSDSLGILKELSLRSGHKYVGSNRINNILQETREVPTNTALSLKFASILKTMGYDILIDGRPIIKADMSKLEMDETDIEKFNSIETNLRGDNNDND